MYVGGVCNERGVRSMGKGRGTGIAKKGRVNIGGSVGGYAAESTREIRELGLGVYSIVLFSRVDFSRE